MLTLPLALSGGHLLRPALSRPTCRPLRGHGAPSCLARGFGPLPEQLDLWEDEEEEEEAAQPAEIDGRRDKMLARWADFVQTGGVKEQQAPVLVQMRDVTVHLGGRAVLQNATWAAREGHVVGVLGESGCGKSTQLRILAGALQPEAGTVERRDGLCVGHVVQGAEATLLGSQETVREFAARLSGAAAEERGHWEARVLEALRATGGGGEALLLAQRVGTLSPGQRARLAVLAALAPAPQLLLLDEPTNHLDLDGLEWLEAQLQGAMGAGDARGVRAAVLVSHDREFLERVCTHTLDASGGKPRLYRGGYLAYLELRAQRREVLAQQQAAAREASARGDGAPELRLKPARFRIAPAAQSKAARAKAAKAARAAEAAGGEGDGDVVLRLSAAEVRFDAAPAAPAAEGGGGAAGGGRGAVLRGVELGVRRGERLLLLGANGAGKSTLLRAALGLQPLSGGAARLGAGARPFYFAQDAAERLAGGAFGGAPAGAPGGGAGAPSVLAAAVAAQPHAPEEAVRRALKQMGLPRETHGAPVASLSGGERARFCLAQMLVSRADLLLLDEPTNHLDLCAREALEEALRYFDGTLLLVSHDRWFAAQTTSAVAELRAGTLARHEGDYRAYLQRHAALRGRLQARQREGASAPLLTTHAPQLRTGGGKVIVAGGRELDAKQAKGRKRKWRGKAAAGTGAAPRDKL